MSAPAPKLAAIQVTGDTMVAAATARLRELEAQRDRLAAALKGLVECLEDGAFDESYADLMRERGRAALAEVKGEPA